MMARLWFALLVTALVAVHTSARNVPTDQTVVEKNDASNAVPNEVVVLDHGTNVPAEAAVVNTETKEVTTAPPTEAVVHNDAKSNVGNKNGVKDKKCLVGFAGIGGAAGVGTVFPVLGGVGGVGGAAGGLGGVGGVPGLGGLAGGMGGFKKGGFIIP